MEFSDFAKACVVSTAMSHLLSSIHIKLSVIPLEIAALFLVDTTVMIVMLQLDCPLPQQLTSVSNRLVTSSIRASHSLTRQSTIKLNSELMSKSTHESYSDACTLNHDENGNTPLTQTYHQNHKLTQKANDPSNALSSDLSVIVVDESCITRFNYWDQGIRQGMTFSNDLYTYFQCFTSRARFRAYDVGYGLAERGIGVCISVSEGGYRVWLNLRSLSTEIGAEIKAEIQAK